MNPKALKVLAVVAAALAIAAIVSQRVERGTDSGSTLVGSLLVPGLSDALGSIDHVEIVGPGNEPIASLDLTEDGWVVEEQDGYPADVTKLRDALVALSEARIVEEKTSNPDFYDRLGLGPIESPDAGGVAVRIAAGDRTFPEVVLGQESGSSYSFARRGDEPTTALVDRAPDLPLAPAQWVVPDIIDLRSDRVQRVEITHADGERLVISKAAPEQTNFTVQDIPEGRELQYASVANVTGNALRELRLEQAARGLPDDAAPDATSEFRTFDGLVVTANGYTIGDETWLTFSARFDPEQALDFATDTIEGSVAGEAPTESSAAESSAEDPSGAGSSATGSSDASAEAAELASRLSPWRFRIPAHQYDQITRRMSDLLREPAADSE